MSTRESLIEKNYLRLYRSVYRLRSILELRWALLTHQREWLLRRSFNRWARRGLEEEMEQRHSWFTEKVMQKMNLSPGDRILELGCGGGWACRRMARRVGDGSQVVGLDISDEMILRARAKSGEMQNVTFLCGSAEHIPCGENFFNKVFAIETFYYFEHQEGVLSELLRVMVPRGQLFLLVCLFKENPKSLLWVDELEIPVQVRSTAEYQELLQSAGLLDVQMEILDAECRPGAKPSGHDRALLITARKPDSEHGCASTNDSGSTFSAQERL